jgi:hypothetical protein
LAFFKTGTTGGGGRRAAPPVGPTAAWEVAEAALDLATGEGEALGGAMAAGAFAGAPDATGLPANGALAAAWARWAGARGASALVVST